MFMLVSTSFFITTVTADSGEVPGFSFEVDGPYEGQASVEMTWTLTVHGGTPPYTYCGGWGDSPPGMDYIWCTFDTYDNPYVVSKTYTEEGVYSIYFSVRDSAVPKNEGIHRRNITVGPAPFKVEIIPPDVNEIWVNEEYQWDCEVTGAHDMSLVSYYWEFGDGEWSEEKSPTHVYTEPTLPDGPPHQYTTVYLEATYVPDPSQPMFVFDDDWHNITNGVWGFDLEIRVDVLGNPTVIHPLIPYFFTITTKLIRDQSNVNSDGNWGVYWEWPFGGDVLPNYHGTYNGEILYEQYGHNVQQKTIIRLGPIGGWNPGTYCPFNVELIWTSIYEWNPDNNDDHVDLWYKSLP